LIRTIGAFAPVTAVSAAGTMTVISPETALAAALKSIGIGIEDVQGSVTSSLVYFPVTPGVVTLAYQQFTYTTGPGDYLTVVDAATGALLWRKNSRAYQSLPTEPARFSVYVQADGKTPADSLRLRHAPLSVHHRQHGQSPDVGRCRRRHARLLGRHSDQSDRL
jgi:hypothetical protein